MLFPDYVCMMWNRDRDPEKEGEGEEERLVIGHFKNIKAVWTIIPRLYSSLMTWLDRMQQLINVYYSDTKGKEGGTFLTGRLNFCLVDSPRVRKR